VLVVEDNDLNVKLFVTLIEQQGYESLFAKDGKEAIKVAKEALPDLILMDDQLPEISGLEVVRRLRAEEGTRRIPIIAVFGAFDERAALDAGCDAYVSKPIKVRNFLGIIESFLSKCDHQDVQHRSG
jgi:two-component system cell cycle response regulator DivK